MPVVEGVVGLGSLEGLGLEGLGTWRAGVAWWVYGGGVPVEPGGLRIL